MEPQLTPQEVAISVEPGSRTASSAAAIRRTSSGLYFVLPAVLMLTMVLVLPITSGLYLSLFAASPVTSSFVGLDNFGYLIESTIFWAALWNTVVFTAVSVAGHLVVGLFAALLVNERIKGRTLARILLLIPWVIPPVIIGMTWRWMYDPLYGIINSLLRQAHLSDGSTSWLGSINLAMPAVLVTNIWHGFPFMMVMLLAGLQAVPAQEYEAAMIDGASAWQRFLHVTLANVRPIIMIGITLDTIWQFRNFDVIQVMTNGGPMRSTEVLSTLVYREMFGNFRFGIASAVGTTMFVITTLLSLVYIAMLKDTE